MAKKAEPKDIKSEKNAKSKQSDSKEAKGKSKNETKKAASAQDAKNKGGIKKYFRDLKSEIKKVVWPSREKVVNNTGVVLAVIAVCAVALFGIDSLLAVAVNALLSIGA